MLFLADRFRWRLVTFQDPDFDPGFATVLPLEGRHTIEISVFSGNAATATRSLVAEARAGEDEPMLLLT